MIRTQQQVLAQMEIEARRAVRSLEGKKLDLLKRLMHDFKRSLRRDILEIYHLHHGSVVWDLGTASSALAQISMAIMSRLDIFYKASAAVMRSALRDIYDVESSYAMWILDQTTPPSRAIKKPQERYLEAAKKKKPETSISDRWAEQVTAYANNLHQNIRLGAMNGSTASDAADEVDATKVGTPAYDLDNIMEKVFVTAAIGYEAAARDDVADANDEVIEKEIWQTMMDATVCPICDDNVGLTPEEADDDIPAHPLCRCFWRYVPVAYADLLSSGDEDEKELARRMEDAGMAGDAMPALNDDGNIIGRVIVKFNDWLGRPENVIGAVPR